MPGEVLGPQDHVELLGGEQTGLGGEVLDQAAGGQGPAGEAACRTSLTHGKSACARTYFALGAQSSRYARYVPIGNAAS